jgi:predicted nucleic acid-binding protein
VILLDTNVLSALMQRDANPTVVAWLDAQPSESIWTSAVSVFEVRFGLRLLGPRRRRAQLEEAFACILADDLQGRVLPFDQVAAEAAAAMAADQRRAGRAIEIRDVEIAGIAAARRATVATRNVKHFEGLGVTLVDPWSA